MQTVRSAAKENTLSAFSSDACWFCPWTVNEQRWPFRGQRSDPSVIANDQALVSVLLPECVPVKGRENAV